MLRCLLWSILRLMIHQTHWKGKRFVNDRALSGRYCYLLNAAKCLVSSAAKYLLASESVCCSGKLATNGSASYAAVTILFLLIRIWSYANTMRLSAHALHSESDAATVGNNVILQQRWRNNIPRICSKYSPKYSWNIFPFQMLMPPSHEPIANDGSHSWLLAI